MKNLQIYLNDVVLEEIDPMNKEHKFAIKKLRDYQGRKMMFDIKQEVMKINKYENHGTSFLVKKDEDYIGYMCLEIRYKMATISMLINKKLRGLGYGKIVINNISDYLFSNDFVERINVYIKDKNKVSINMVKTCNFMEYEKLRNDNITVYSKLK